MARHGIVAFLAATVLGVGVNASPCKPYSSVALSSTVTLATTTTAATQETASSTITADVTDTTSALQTTVTEVTTGSIDTTDVVETTLTTSAFDTTVTEASSGSTDTTEVLETTTTEGTSDTTGVVETTATDTTTAPGTTTDAVETTTTEPVGETSTTVEPTTTTTTAAGPPVCVETQILVNPSFDNNNDGSPWVLGSGVTVSQINPRSAPNFLYNTLNQGRTTTTFSQTLPALGPFIYQLDYYFNLQTAIQGRGFACSVTPRINQQVLNPGETLTDSGPYGFRLSSQGFTVDDPDSPATLSITVQCQGSFNTVIIGVDDFALTRLCNAS
ncbi:hypothetical protein F53441_1946 [Fusarium austroafricanum]|uniref:CBM-cenC domain-containing protein n=1 Tax=Fusarium austroafricanum TaxID=2364996 RepID=A0A8H4PCJ4_9HYPO|nr:hypothetical protein F53441_1946 [Fusarium austroafricanum]